MTATETQVGSVLGSAQLVLREKGDAINEGTAVPELPQKFVH